MEVAIAFWIICGVVSAIVASSRGADSMAAFLIGIAFGPLGIVIAFVLKPAAPREAQASSAGLAQDRETYVKCGACAGFTPSHGQYCHLCGEALKSA